MKIKEAIEYWEVFNSEIDDLYNTCSDEERGILEKQRDVVEFTISALRELVARRSNRSMKQEGAVMEWISVKDRLPEEKVNCIVLYQHAYCNNDGYWAIGFCCYDGEKFLFDPAYKVTHWMPLPEPQKENDFCSYGERKEGADNEP